MLLEKIILFVCLAGLVLWLREIENITLELRDRLRKLEGQTT